MTKRDTGLKIERIAGALISARSTIPALSCMHVRNGILYATNHRDTMLQVPTTLEDGSYDRRATKLQTTHEFDLAELRAFFCVSHDPADPALVDHTGPCSDPMHFRRLAQDVDMVFHGCNPNTDRPVLRSVRVHQWATGNLEVTATDGKILASYPLARETYEDTYQFEPFCIPYEAARILSRWAALKDDSGGWHVSLSDDAIIAYEERTGAYLVVKRTEDHAYPDVHKLLRDGRVGTIIAFDVPTDDTLSALEPAKHHKGLITMSPYATVTDDKLASVEMSLPLTRHRHFDAFKLSMPLLLSALKASDMRVDFYGSDARFGEPGTTVTLKDTRGLTHMLIVHP